MRLALAIIALLTLTACEKERREYVFVNPIIGAGMSMYPMLQAGDELYFIFDAPFDSLRMGDVVITSANGYPITHKIVDVRRNSYVTAPHNQQGKYLNGTPAYLHGYVDPVPMTEDTFHGVLNVAWRDGKIVYRRDKR